MSNLKSKITLKRVISAATVGVLLMALNVTGVLGTFYKGITAPFLGASQYTFDTNYGYGYGYDDTGAGFGYGYGYGATITPANTGGGGGGSSGSSSSSSSSNSTATCSDSDLICKEASTDVYKLYKKDGVSCEGGNLGKACEASSEGESPEEETGEQAGEQEGSEQGQGSSNGGVVNTLGGRITVKDGVATMNGCQFPVKPHTFLDDDNTFATEYITLLQQLGIVNGRDGNGQLFVPESDASRFEFIKMTERVFCLDYSSVDTSSLPFTDVNKLSWQGRVAQKALDAGLVTSLNPLFRGDEPISRIEAFKVLTLAAGMTVTPTDTTVFTDVTIDWMKKYAETVRIAGIANGQTINGNLVLEPLRNITRAESAKTIVKAIWTK